MVNMKVILFMFCLCFLTVFSSASLDIQIRVRESFKIGEEIVFDYGITSTQDEKISYAVSVLCGENYLPLLDLEEADLKANVLFSGTYSYGKVDGGLSSADCLAMVSIMDPVNQEYSKPFSIVGPEVLLVNLKICSDVGCKTPEGVFNRGEKVFLDYSSNVLDVELTVELKTPSSGPLEINLPYGIVSKDVGTYEVSVIAKKEGYKDINLKKQFAVIEEKSKIIQKDLSDVPIADPPKEKVTRDSASNIPMSEPDFSKVRVGKGWIVFFVVVFILIVLFVVAFIIARSYIKGRNNSFLN